jgi:hypothetical protein
VPDAEGYGIEKDMKAVNQRSGTIPASVVPAKLFDNYSPATRVWQSAKQREWTYFSSNAMNGVTDSSFLALIQCNYCSLRDALCEKRLM